MADDQPFESGVASVFEAIASQRKGEQPVKAAPPVKRVKKKITVPAETASASESARGERPVPRTGRFPGRKNGPRKEKITGRIAPDLRDAYVKWALDDRCAVQDLFERALIEFYQRHHTAADNDK